ncbi:MAG: LytTR family transcriptional regulator DNA-binding domain-containing protein [Lachnospiraceae bacterium]|nr:LytTR family transcriptional regulator DNA-binding domain-containing protein [Lachnospiraceae bacterium]
MKIKVNIDSSYKETEITINTNSISDELEKLVASLRVLDLKLTGMKGNQTYILDAAEVLYIDTTDKKTFIYTGSSVYETSLKLYELEHKLSTCDFFRAGKSSIINFNKIKSLKSDLDGRLIVTMENNERLIVSRQYVSFVKNKLNRRD